MPRAPQNHTLSWSGWICLGTAGLMGCSLQNFDRLERGLSASAGTAPMNGAGGSAGEASAGRGGSGAEGGADGGAAGQSETGGSAGQATAGATADSGTGEPANPALVNPSFEEGYAGWLAEPAGVLGVYAFVQWPTTGSTTVDGLNELSTWAESTAFTVRIYQSLSGLGDGQYVLKGNFNFGTGHNAVQVFARGCGGVDRQEDVPQTLPSQWLQFELTDIQVIGGSCEVGFFVDANPNNWLNADLFSFVPAAE